MMCWGRPLIARTRLLLLDSSDVAANETCDSLEARARSFGPPVAALEVHESSGYDTAVQRWVNRFKVCAVLRAPGPDDSRFRVEPIGYLLVGHGGVVDSAVCEVALRTLNDLAGRLDAPLYPPAGQAMACGSPGWIMTQGPSPERIWHIEWEVVSWQPDGRRMASSGKREEVQASGNAALAAADRGLEDARRRPFEYIRLCVETQQRSQSRWSLPYPSLAPSKRAIRERAAEAQTFSAIACGLAEEAPELSILERMVVLEQALMYDLRSLVPLGAFYRGEIGAEALETDLRERLRDKESWWRLSLDLDRAFSREQSVSSVLHAYYAKHPWPMALIVGLREAFDIGLAAAKDVMDTACDGTRNDEADRILRDAVAALRTR